MIKKREREREIVLRVKTVGRIDIVNVCTIGKCAVHS